MTMTIGRASLPSASCPTSLTANGDDLTIGVTIRSETFDSARAIRQQLLGLSVGEVIPITWSEDDTVDGFYAVQGVSVDPTRRYLVNGRMNAAVSVRRVGGGYANALIELVSVLTEDTSVPYGAGAGPFNRIAVPGSALGVTIHAVDAGGDVAYASANTGGDLTTPYRVAPSAFYEGSASIEVRSGGVWRPVVGRQIPRVDVEDVRLTNGVIRVGFERDPAKFTVSRFNGTSFAVTHKWVVPDGAMSAINAEWVDSSVVVISNDVTGATLRLLLEQESDADPSSIPQGTVFGVDVLFGLQRGDRGVKVTATRSTKGTAGVDFQYDGPVSATTEQYSASTYTSGYRTTTGDADGLRAFCIPGRSVTASTTGFSTAIEGEMAEFGVLAASGNTEIPVLGMKKSERQRVIT